MNPVTLDGWCKPDDAANPIPVESIHFFVTEMQHRELERAEEELQQTQAKEKLIDVDLDSLKLEVSPDCGPLEECQFRVYLSPIDQRGHFHLVGRRIADHSLVYSNSVMVDQLESPG